MIARGVLRAVSSLLLGLAVVLIVPDAAMTAEAPQEVQGRVVRVARDRVSINIGTSRGIRVGLEGTVWYEVLVRGAPARRITVGVVKVVAVQADTADLKVEQARGPIQIGYSVTLPVAPQEPPSSAGTGGAACTGLVVVKTEPPGALIHVAGVPLRDASPTVAEGVPCGTQDVVATLENYESERQSVQVQQNRSTQVVLTLAKRRAGVRVIVVPEGAEVWVDGLRAGVAPVTVSGVELGQHRLRVEKDGFTPFDGSIDVASAGLLEYRITLSPVAVSCSGNVFVHSEPSGASVEMDGQAIRGRTPVAVESIPCGRHRVTVRLTDHRDAVRDVDVRDRRITEIAVTLTKQQGALQIDVDPPGADVFVDGRRIGSAPVVVDPVDAGRHVVRVERAGFTPEERGVNVDAGDRLRLHVSLVAAAPQQASVLVSAFGYEGVGGLQGALTLGILASEYAIELDGDLVVTWHIRGVEERVSVPSGQRRLRVLIRNVLAREPVPVYDEMVTLDGRDNRVHVNFLLGTVEVNGTKAELQKPGTLR